MLFKWHSNEYSSIDLIYFYQVECGKQIILIITNWV